MTTLAKIGPLEFDQAHEIVDPESDPGKFNLSIKCTPERAKQLIGLCETLTRSESNKPRIIHSKNNRWGLMPIESPVESVTPSVNEYTGILKGLVALSNPMEYFINTRKTRVVMEGELISNNVDEILTMHYTRGGEDGTDIEHNYEDLTPAYIINESGADFDTTNDWFPIAKYRMAGGAASSNGSEIVFSGGADADGVPGQVWTNHRTQFSHGFVMEFTLHPGSKPSAGNKDKDINVWFSPNRSSSNPPVWNNSYMVSLGVSTSNQYYQVHTIGSPGGGSWWNLVPITVDNSPTAFKFRLSTDSKYYVKIELNRYVSGSWTGFSTIFYGPTNMGAWKDLYMGVYYLNRDSTTNSMSISDVKVYNYLESDKPNVVVLPPDATPNLAPTFYRASAEGNIQCFENLADHLNFQITPANYYKGTVKGMNSKYKDNVARLVTHNEMDLEIGKFYVTNGIIKLVPTSNGVEAYHWNGSDYALVDTFTFTHLTKLIRPFQVSPFEFTLQLDRSFWTLRAGRPSLWVEHEHDDIGYTLRTCYEHDGSTTTSPAADADISMDEDFFCKMWNKGTGTCAAPNPTQRYRMMITQQYKTTIKSDSIPANHGITGIIIYDSNINDTARDGAIYRARELYRPTKQAIGLQGV